MSLVQNVTMLAQRIGQAFKTINAQQATLAGQVGTVANLTTTAKSNLVGAVNEVSASVPTAVASAVAAQGVNAVDLPTVAAVAAGAFLIHIAPDGVVSKILASAIQGSGPTPDVTIPAFPNGAVLNSTNVTQTGFTLTASASATDNIAVTRYEYSTDAGTTWSNAGTSPTATISTALPGTTYQCRMRALDAAGNPSVALAVPVTTLASADTVDPVMGGSLSITNVTATGYTMGWTAGTDNVGIAGYDVSTNGVDWTQLGNVLTYAVSTASQGTTYNPRVRARDPSNRLSNVLTAPVTTLSQQIVVTTPATATAGTSYTASGTWVNQKPATLQFAVADNGGTLGAFSTPTNIAINDNGTWSFTATPTTASTSRTMTVKDPATGVSGTSGAYVVNAAPATMASKYQITSSNNATTSFPTAALGTSNAFPNQIQTVTARVNVRSAQTTAATYPANTDFKLVWGKVDTSKTLDKQVCPITFANTNLPANSGNGNTVQGATFTIGSPTHLGSWQDNTSPNFGTFGTASSLYAMGVPGDYVLWVVFSDGSSKMYDNNLGQNNPLIWTLTA